MLYLTAIRFAPASDPFTIYSHSIDPCISLNPALSADRLTPYIQTLSKTKKILDKLCQQEKQKPFGMVP